MHTGYFNNIHPFTKIILSFVIAIILFFIVSFVGAIIPMLVFDVSMEKLMSSLQDFSDQENISLLKYFQILQTLGLFIIPAILLAILFFEQGLKQFGFQEKTTITTLGWVVVIMLFGLPVINVIAEWNSGMKLPSSLSSLETVLKNMEESAAQLTNAFLSTNTFSGLLVNLLMIAVLPAIGEELFFRGLIQRFFINWTKIPWMGIVLGAFLFSFMHLQFYGFIPRMYMGIIFGLIYYWTGSMWFPILAHFVNNGTAVMVYYFFGEEVAENTFDTIGTQEGNWYFFVFSLAFVFVALWQISKEKKPETINI